MNQNLMIIHYLQIYFDTLKIDSQKIADGLNDYVNKTGTPNNWESTNGVD
jgi:hypothetical protein